MANFTNKLNFKITSLVVIVSLFFTSILYGIEPSDTVRGGLRVPLLCNKERIEQDYRAIKGPAFVSPEKNMFSGTSDRDVFRILAVCNYNYNRSPAMEMIFAYLIENSGVANRIAVSSGAVKTENIDGWGGVNESLREAFRSQFGKEPREVHSKMLTAEQVRDADFIVVPEKNVKLSLEERFGNEVQGKNIIILDELDQVEVKDLKGISKKEANRLLRTRQIIEKIIWPEMLESAVLQRFKEEYLGPMYEKIGKGVPSLEKIRGDIKASNAQDSYRVKENLPITIVFDGSVYKGAKDKEILWVIYTSNKDFDAISVICGREENKERIVGIAGVRYYDLRSFDNIAVLSKRLCEEAVYLADRMDLKTLLWDNPLDGASVVILPSHDEVEKKEVLRSWAKSMVNCGILGKYLILKSELGTNETDMSILEGAVTKAKRELKEYNIDTSDLYIPVATSRRLQDDKWSHREWKSTSIGIVESLITAVRMLKRHEEDFPGIMPLSNEKLRVIIDGASSVSDMIKDLLSSEMYLNQLKELGLEIEIIDIKTRRELLSQEADVLIVADTMESNIKDDYKNLNVSLLVEGVSNIVDDYFYFNLEKKGILCIPAIITSGGGAYTSFEEFFHSQVPMEIEDIKEHVLHQVECTAITLTRLAMKRWALLRKSGKEESLYKLTENIANDIRQLRDSFLAHPTEDVSYRAELDAIRNLPDKIAWMLASCQLARKEALFKEEDTDKLIHTLQNSTGKYGQMDAAYILGEKLEDKPVPALLEALSDKKRDYRVRRNAAEALGKIGNASAIGQLRVSAQKDTDKKVRDMCKWALECIGVEIKEPQPLVSQRKLESSKDAIDTLAQEVVSKWRDNIFREKQWPTLIAITGYSAAGKSYFSRDFIEVLRKQLEVFITGWQREHPNIRLEMPKIVTIDFDNYILAKEQRPTQLHSLGKFGSSQPEKWLGKWEFARFYKDMHKLRKGETIYMPSFDQVTRKRKVDENGNELLIPIRPGYDIILVEGVFVLSSLESNQYYDLKIFLDAEWELRRNRDIERYIEEGKYYNLPVSEVEEKFERKHQTEEIPSITEEIAYADIVLSTDNIKPPLYVAKFYGSVKEYSKWQKENVNNQQNISLTLFDKEKKLEELYNAPEFNGIRGSPLEEKVWARLYQNTIAVGNAVLFNAISELVTCQSKQDWPKLDILQKEKILETIKDKFKLEGDDWLTLQHAYQPSKKNFPAENSTSEPGSVLKLVKNLSSSI